MKRIIAITALILAPLTAWAQDADDDFFGEDSPSVVAAPVSSVDPTKQFSENAEGLRWGGTVTSEATWNGGWVDQWPGANLGDGWRDGLSYGLSTKLFLDGRPDENFRFRLSLKTGYPFTNDSEVVSGLGPTTTIKTPNIKVWEMFTDVTVEDALFLRFGKQSASWGVSYFYSPGDVISLTAKEASDPTAEREGPVALKATVPFPGLKANLTGFVIVRESYFAGELPSLKNLGYALQADALVGAAQVSLGGFYQRDNAPKLVATINTGLNFLDLPILNNMDLFSEAVFSYGSDALKGSGSDGDGAFAVVDEWNKGLYYTGTVGLSYSNSDANLSLRTEYLYNPFGSSESDYAGRAFNTIFSGAAMNNANRSYSYGDAATPGVHYLTTLGSLSKLFGSDKLGFSTLWQQNFSDASGWVNPSFSFAPWDVLSFTWGFSVVYGDEGSQYPTAFQAYDPKTGIIPIGTKRVTFEVGVKFGTGKY